MTDPPSPLAQLHRLLVEGAASGRIPEDVARKIDQLAGQAVMGQLDRLREALDLLGAATSSLREAAALLRAEREEHQQALAVVLRHHAATISPAAAQRWAAHPN